MVGKKIYELNDTEVEILRHGVDDPDVVTDYFFRVEGDQHGWKLDENFLPEGVWQKAVHHALQKRLIVIGGFGSGKTRGIALSAGVWCITTRDFMFMNCAPTSYQSELMYKFVVDYLGRDTPFEKMIFAKPKRPYPMVDIRFRVKGVLIHSTMEFMSIDKNANAILSWEGDWVNIDEAGLIDDLEQTIINLGSRMRGRVRGRDRLARLSMTSNSWDNSELWYRHDLAKEIPNDYLSITVSSRHNKNITDEQLRLQLKDIPEEEHDRYIDGARPEGKGNYFSKQKVYACEDEAYSQFILGGVEGNLEGFDAKQTYGCGITYFHTPVVKNHLYMLLGDPGIGNAPNRNAPALQVWDVTDFPKYRASLVAYLWGRGNGSISPFILQLFKFMAMYNPIVTAVDNTGPQKNTAELLNTYLQSSRTNKETAFDWLGETIDLSGVLHLAVGGLDFSGGKKNAYLIAGRLMLEAKLFTWPKFVVGMRSQLTNYDPEKDVAGKPKIAQDLVATYCMSATVVQTWFHIDPASLDKPSGAQNPEILEQILGRESRVSGEDRSVTYSRPQ